MQNSIGRAKYENERLNGAGEQEKEREDLVKRVLDAVPSDNVTKIGVLGENEVFLRGADGEVVVAEGDGRPHARDLVHKQWHVRTL